MAVETGTTSLSAPLGGAQEPDVFQRLIATISAYLEQDLSSLRRDTRVLNAIPGIDSLRLKEMLLYVEEAFDIEFTPEVMDHLSTLQALADHIAHLTAMRLSAPQGDIRRAAGE